MGKLLGGFLLPHPPILISEIGQGQEENALKTLKGYGIVVEEIKRLDPDILILITPHGPLFSDANSIYMEEHLWGDFSSFGHPQLSYKFKNNLDLGFQIVKNSLKKDIPIAQMTKEMFKNYKLESKLDHGVLVPLHFISKSTDKYKIVPITYGLLSPIQLYNFGKEINQAIQQQEGNTVVIASGDLSHKLSNKGPYTLAKEGVEFDSLINELIDDNKLEEILTIDLDFANKAGECGLRSLMILVGILSDYQVSSRMISYEGPFGVGYGTAEFKIIGEEKKNHTRFVQNKMRDKTKDSRKVESEHVRIARLSLEHFINTGMYMDVPDDVSQELLSLKLPVFVSIKKNGNLRGCIGSTKSFEVNTAKEIIKYAVEAGIRDFRFPPITIDELDDLAYSVDVLYESEDVQDLCKLDPLKFGVIVKKGNRSGLLLPNLEGVDTAKEQIRIALNKAGINENEKYEIKRFRVDRFK